MLWFFFFIISTWLIFKCIWDTDNIDNEISTSYNLLNVEKLINFLIPLFLVFGVKMHKYNVVMCTIIIPVHVYVNFCRDRSKFEIHILFSCGFDQAFG